LVLQCVGVIIITSERASARISTYLADSYKNDLRIDLIVTPDGIETGDALLYAKDKIKVSYLYNRLDFRK
jgi:hypothetical protein